jgi:uncharacterized protein YihD (DUF1040 family)
MRYTVNLEIDLADIPFIKKAIQDRTDDLLEYIDTLSCMKVKEVVEGMEKEKEEEIKDIEIDQFQADLRDMIAKHTPKKLGRPKGSKNKVKTNAE